MKIKLDENMPFGLVDVLDQMGHEVDTVPQEGLAGYDDTQIWKTAQKEGRFLITQDLDFSDIRLFMPGTHYGLLIIRLRDPGRNSLLEMVRSIFQTENIDDWKGCFAVATEHKLRIRYPQE